MKKSLLLLIAVLFAGMAFAQDRKQVYVEYTNGVYRGFTYEDIQSQEDDFIKDKDRYESRFWDSLLKHYKGVALRAADIREAEHLLTINIIQVTGKGAITAEVSYGDAKATLYSKGGKIGSFMNLFGDGMDDLGKQVAKWLKKNKL